MDIPDILWLTGNARAARATSKKRAGRQGDGSRAEPLRRPFRPRTAPAAVAPRPDRSPPRRDGAMGSIASLPRRTIRSLVSRRPCQNRSSPCSIRGGVHAIAGRSGRSSPSSSPTLRRPWHILKRVPAPAATPNLMGGDLVDEQSTSKRSWKLQRKLVGLCVVYLPRPK